MKKDLELLAPGGDVDAIKAAIAAGADAVYCGVNNFNARRRATNIELDDLNGILHLAHENNCKVYLTLNIIIVESEFRALINLLNKLANTSLDGVIVQDLGLFYLLSKHFKGLEIHASTQLTTHNEGQIKFLNKLAATRVNLSRELNLDEIEALALVGHENDISTEVFVHGSYCISFSGLCYMSSVLAGRSGNRGRCSQPCRDRYATTPEGKKFPLNLKDNSAYSDLRELYDAGVDSIKIEGRIKKFDYVYTVVHCWKKQLSSFFNNNKLENDDSDLYKVFNRDFSDSYLKGNITKNLFIDNPRDNSIKQFSEFGDHADNPNLPYDKDEFYAEKERISACAKKKIEHLSIAKIPLTIRVSGECDAPLKVNVQTPETSFTVLSKTNLVEAKTYTNNRKTALSLDYEYLAERFNPVNNTEYYIKELQADNLQDGLVAPFKEITRIKNKIVGSLNGSMKFVDPVSVPALSKRKTTHNPVLSVLISSPGDLYLCDRTSADIFFQLPNCMANELPALVDLFLENKEIIPWFPSILIGEDYTAAVEFLQKVQPKLIVTNNTGIAYAACDNGIPWVAGPYLNIVNSFSLQCLQEFFNCRGAFISNELSKKQIKNIVPPEDFKLYYSIYHPVLLMVSRQCLFHQVVGCEKESIDDECLQKCNKSSSITTLKQEPLFIKKTKGNYHCVYNNNNFLNTDIASDFPGVFSSFFIDLRDVQTETRVEVDKSQTIKLFEDFLKGNPGSAEELRQKIYPSTDAQYKKGI